MSNYDSNPYNGGGGYGGGGFVAGGSPYGSQDSPGGGGGKKPHNNTIRPVTIKQIMSATQPHGDADFTLDGHDFRTVTLVGSVHNKSASATNVSYEIGDGTGYIDVRLWLDAADDGAGADGEGGGAGEQDKYIAVLGQIKLFGGKRHISATHVRLIEDPNEVAHHLLKATYVSLKLRNPGGGAGAGANGDAMNGTRADASDYTANVAQANESAYAALPPLQKSIMELVAQDDTDDGPHVSVISRGVSANGRPASGEQVMEAIEHLMSEGMLFSTIDDLHVKAI